MRPDRLYFLTFPSEYTPIYVAIGMIVLLIIMQFILGNFLKKRKICGKKSFIIYLIFNIIFLVIFLSVCEYQASLVEDKINRIAVEKNSLCEVDMLLLWRAQKNQKNNNKHGYWTFSTDSWGLRSLVEVPLKKEKDEYRILVLGDSWTFGSGVNDRETFCYQLEKNLRKRYPDKKITVINGGCLGYCLAQGNIFLKQRGIDYKPDLIIVKNLLNNYALPLFMNMDSPNSPGVIQKIKHLLWKSSLYLYIRRIIYKYNFSRNPGRIEKISDDEEREYTFSLLREIDKYCKKRNIEVVYLNVDFKGNERNSDSRLRKFALLNDKLLVDIELNPREDPQQIIDDPDHPGANNHKIIAGKLETLIVKEKLITK